MGGHLKRYAFAAACAIIALLALIPWAVRTEAADPLRLEVASMPGYIYDADYDITGGYTLGAWNEHQVYKALIYWGVSQDLTPDEIGLAVRIVKRESNFNPYALNTRGEYSVGPAQFNRRGGLWRSLPPGREGWPDTNAAQQMRALTWGLHNGYASHWMTACERNGC